MSEDTLKTALSDEIYNKGDLVEIALCVVYSTSKSASKLCRFKMHYHSNVILPSSAEIALELYRQGVVELTHDAFVNVHDTGHVLISGNLNLYIGSVEKE